MSQPATADARPSAAALTAAPPTPRAFLLRSGAWYRLAWQVPAAVFIWLSLIQWPVAPSPGLDPSWQLVLSDAWRQGRQFGREIIFTWGPWGFLVMPYVLPEVVQLKVAFELVSKLVLAAGVVSLAAGLDIIRRVLFLLAVITLGPLFLDSLLSFLAVAIVVRWLIAPEARTWQVAAACGALAFLSLVKFTNLAFAVGGVAVAAAVCVAISRRRRAGAIAAGFGLAVMVLWIAAGQHPANLPAFLRFGLDMSAGYAMAMGWDETWPIFRTGALLAAAFVVWIGIWLWPRRRSVESWAVAAVVLAGVYLSWKHGFTRADGHVLIFFIFGVFLSAAMPAVMRGATAWLPAALTLALALNGIWGVAPHFLQASHVWARDRVLDTVSRLAGRVPWREALAAQTRETAQAWRFPETAAVVGTSTVDLIDFTQGLLFLNGYNYHPRPVPQSYAAFTPALLRENLAFFESDRAPEFLLLGATAVDDRYLGLTDSLVMAELPRRYEIVLEESHHTLLRRRAVRPPPGSLALTPLMSVSVRIGESIELPDEPGHALWMEVRSSLSALGHLRSLLYKPPLLFLTAENESQRGTLRLVPGIAEAGFVLQPFIADQTDLRAFLRGESVRRARRVQFDASAGQERYWGSFNVRVSRMDSLPILRSEK